MASKTNKTTEVLKHLQRCGSITSIEAINLFGATRLSAIIFNLRKKGYNIATVDNIAKDRYGHTVSYAKYILSNGNNIPNQVTQEPNSLFDSLFKEENTNG